MSDKFYAYINRVRATEDYAIFSAEMKKKEEKARKIQDFFYETKIPLEKQEVIMFQMVAISSKAIVFVDDLQLNYWVAEYNKNNTEILNFTRCTSLNHAKHLYYKKSHEDSLKELLEELQQDTLE